MEIKKIINFCKKRGVLYLFDGDGCQWISDGVAVYPLFNLPIFDEESILKAYDINGKKAEKLFMKRDDHLPEAYDFSDDVDGELVCKMGDVIFGDALAISTSAGLMFIDRKYLSPFRDMQDDMLYIYERMTKGGETYFAIKIGFSLVGIVMPYDCVNESFVEKLGRYYEQSRVALENKNNAGR
jgi:hypothetical protein